MFSEKDKLRVSLNKRQKAIMVIVYVSIVGTASAITYIGVAVGGDHYYKLCLFQLCGGGEGIRVEVVFLVVNKD